MNDLDPTQLTQDQEDENRRSLTEWFKEHLDATAVRIERQDRWRPAWYIDATIGGETRSFYARGDRGQMFFLPWGLDREIRILEVLHANGIPVPRVFGMCDDPKAIIMEAVDGSRDLTGLSEDEARSIMDQYVDILRAVHAIDVEEFGTAGIPVPSGPAETALIFFGPTEEGFEDIKVGPDAFVAYVRRWIHRNLPLHRNQLAFVLGDPGQFLVKDGKIVSLIDFEVSYVGDPMADLGGLRIRNLEEPFGDAEYVIRRYAQLTGDTLDAPTVNYYVVVLAAVTNMMEHRLLREPKRDTIYWRASEAKAARLTLSAIADVMGVDLPTLTAPASDRRHHQMAYDALVDVIGALPAPTPLDQYNHRNAVALAQHLRDVNAFGLSMDEDELSDIAELIGYRPASIDAAEGPLEAYVMQAGDEDELKLLQFFDRRFQRRRLTLDAHDPRLRLYDLPPLSRILEEV